MVACSAPSESVDVPNNIAYVAILERGPDARVENGSALAPWTDALPVVMRPRQSYWVVGFTAEQLAPFGVESAALPTDRLRAAEGCEPALPAPQVAFTLDDRSLVEISSTAIPRLTADFALDRCPDLLSLDWGIDSRCQSNAYCPVQVSLEAPCIARFDLAACGGGFALVSVNAAGSLCAVIERPEGMCETTATDPFVRFECGAETPAQCRLDIYPESSTAPQPFAATEIPLAAVDPIAPRLEASADRVRAEAMRSGYAPSMAMLADRLVVALQTDFVAQSCPLNSRFVFINPDTLAVESTVIAPPCQRVLAAHADGFFAVHESGERLFIDDFAADGVLRNSLPISDGELGDATRWRTEDLLLSPDGAEVWMVNSGPASRTRFRTAILRFRTADLSRVDEDEIFGPDRAYSAAVVSGHIVLASEENRRLDWVVPGDNTSSREVTLPFDSTFETLHRIYPLGPERMLVGAGGAASVFFVDQSPTRFRGVRHYGRLERQTTISFGPWDDSGLLLATGVRRVSTSTLGIQALVTLLDPVDERFLPGVWPIGDGIATDIIQRDNRHFILLPWAAKVIVLEPR